MMGQVRRGFVKIEDIVWDASVYPRIRWSGATVERYVEALESGAVFPPLVLEEGTNRLLDGKHRLEAYRRLSREQVEVEWHTVPEGMTAKYYAATLSAAHGDRLTNEDLKALAIEEFTANPSMSASEWGRRLGVPERSVRRWVSHITEQWRRKRDAIVWHLYRLGWTQEEIGEKLGIAQRTVSDIFSEIRQMALFAKLLPTDWNEELLRQEAHRLGIPLLDAWAMALDGQPDEKRLERLGIRIQPYDVWHFSGCHDLMGREHPGRIPGELVCHVLYFFTQQGDLVVDPMAGGGTTLDACLLMGRRCRAYDIDLRHQRVDVEQHDLSNGWPETVRKASLIFWDPPYYKKKDAGQGGHGGADGYIEGSISRMEREEYLCWFGEAFARLREMTRPGTKLAFLMSDWINEKKSIFVWDYANLLMDAGWRLVRHIQCPLPTQQVHADFVLKLRASRHLARLNRYLLVCTHGD